MSESALLRRAASMLRETASFADMSAHTFWPEPWKAEDCVQKHPGSPKPCPCIVSQGDLDFGAVQYIADAETPQYATWIAMMSTHLADPLAMMLEQAAESWDAYIGAANHVWPDPDDHRDWEKFVLEATAKLIPAVNIARLILKEEENSA